MGEKAMDTRTNGQSAILEEALSLKKEGNVLSISKEVQEDQLTFYQFFTQ